MQQMPDDLRAHMDELHVCLRHGIDSSKTRAIDGTIATVLLLQCEQLQRLAATLHCIDGSLEALLKEIRRVTTTDGSIRTYDSNHRD